MQIEEKKLKLVEGKKKLFRDNENIFFCSACHNIFNFIFRSTNSSLNALTSIQHELIN